MKPKIVTLCGSTKFGDVFARAQLELTLAGKVVLTVGCVRYSDLELFAHLSPEEMEQTKKRLDALHMQKIEMSDEIFVLNVWGYVGVSTGREIAFAYENGKVITWLEPHNDKAGAKFYYELWRNNPSYKDLVKQVQSMNAEKTIVNRHYWALLEKKLVVVFKQEEEAYYVAGDWECRIPENKLQIIAEIQHPAGYENTPLYYDQGDSLGEDNEDL